MNIIVDLSSLKRKEWTGIEKFTFTFYEGFKKYSIFKHLLKSFEGLGNRKFSILENFIPLINSNNLVIYPAFPTLLPMNNFVPILYDATLWKYPETNTIKAQLFYRNFYEKMIKKSLVTFTISEVSRKDIAYYLNISKNKIINIGMCLPYDFISEKVENPNLDFAKKGEFILSVGSLEPRKNLERLLKAYIELYNIVSDIPNLILVGRKAWLNNKIFETAIKSGLIDKKIFFTGYIELKHLKWLYENALFNVFVSIYEGGGYPILEAAYMGNISLTSKNTSMEEFAKRNAYYVNPFEVEDIKNGLEKLIFNDSLRDRLKGNVKDIVKRNSIHSLISNVDNALERFFYEKVIDNS